LVTPDKSNSVTAYLVNMSMSREKINATL